MIFNSFEFAFFFIIVYAFYLLLRHKMQNLMLLAASYIFYGAWDWRFLSLIFISTVVDYFAGLKIEEAQTQRERKFFLGLSIATNLSILGFFKYFNFFAFNLDRLLESWNFSADPFFLNVILPVGISFYTFQTMSYTIDIYRRELRPTRNFLDFALFVSFFPQLVAGPIERAKRLLPQITGTRAIRWHHIEEGLYLILLGYFQKVFIADNLAGIVNSLLDERSAFHTASVVLGVYAFAFQILGDFAGYSNIARGLSKLMGIDLMLNFNLPYFAKNPSDFWQRWHISLSSWLKDYLYIPLGGNRHGEWKTYRNLMLTMLLGGLWHGAAWTFIIWGFYHGALLVSHRLLAPVLSGIRFEGRLSSRVWDGLQIILFFQLTCLGWLFFRAERLTHAGNMLAGLFNFDAGAAMTLLPVFLKFALILAPLAVLQWFQYARRDLNVVLKTEWKTQGLVYFALIFLTIVFGSEGGQEFIYFQF